MNSHAMRNILPSSSHTDYDTWKNDNSGQLWYDPLNPKTLMAGITDKYQNLLKVKTCSFEITKSEGHTVEKEVDNGVKLFVGDTIQLKDDLTRAICKGDRVKLKKNNDKYEKAHNSGLVEEKLDDGKLKVEAYHGWKPNKYGTSLELFPKKDTKVIDSSEVELHHRTGTIATLGWFADGKPIIIREKSDNGTYTRWKVNGRSILYGADVVNLTTNETKNLAEWITDLSERCPNKVLVLFKDAPEETVVTERAPTAREQRLDITPRPDKENFKALELVSKEKLEAREGELMAKLRTMVSHMLNQYVVMLFLLLLPEFVALFYLVWPYNSDEKESGFLMLQMISGITPTVYCLSHALSDTLTFGGFVVLPMFARIFWGSWFDVSAAYDFVCVFFTIFCTYLIIYEVAYQSKDEEAETAPQSVFGSPKTFLSFGIPLLINGVVFGLRMVLGKWCNLGGAWRDIFLVYPGYLGWYQVIWSHVLRFLFMLFAPAPTLIIIFLKMVKERFTFPPKAQLASAPFVEMYETHHLGMKMGLHRHLVGLDKEVWTTFVFTLAYFFLYIYLQLRKLNKLMSAQEPLEPIPVAGEDKTPEDVMEEAARVDKTVNAGEVADVCLHHLVKTYKRGGEDEEAEEFLAVNDVTFDIAQGQCMGFLGKNGAGKSTVMKMMTHVELPSSGTGYVMGQTTDDAPNSTLEIRKHISYCPQEHAIVECMTGRQLIDFMARVKGIPNNMVESEVERITKILQLDIYLDKKCGTYSGGNKRKLSLAMALVGNRSIALLDEPSTGVDPYSRRFMWDYIRKITPHTAIVLTTHNMEEGEALCSKLGIIVNGSMVCFGSNQNLKNRFMVGYILALSCTSDVQPEIIDVVQSDFPDTQVTDQDAFRLKFSLTASLSDIFTLGEKLVNEHGAQDFVVSQW